MLTTLSPIGDISTLLESEVYENVVLTLRDDVINCSGTLLAARSTVLCRILRHHDTIVLRDFGRDISDQLRQCLELLYGGSVIIDVRNVAVFLKFGVKYQIADLLNVCTVWMESIGLHAESEHILSESEQPSTVRYIDRIDFTKCLRKEKNVKEGYRSNRLYLEEHMIGQNLSRAESRDIKSDTKSPVPQTTIHSSDKPKQLPHPHSDSQISTYKLDLSQWKSFSVEEVERLCSPLCGYPEFAKIEIVIFWLQKQCRPPTECQELFDRLLGSIDPLSLSDRYISFIDNYLRSMQPQARLPPHFDPHSQRSCYLPDDPSSKSRYVMHVWTLKNQDLDWISQHHSLSFYATCNLCDAGTQETVLKLEDRVPVYSLNTAENRRPGRKFGISYPVHYHDKSIKHWIIKVKAGANRNKEVFSLVTHTKDEIVRLFDQYNSFIVACLQLKI